MAKPPGHGRTDWPAAAAKLAAQWPQAVLDSSVVAAADALPPRTIWGVGFSGGPDSLALLLLLWAHWPKRRRWLRGLHFDHRMRGRESTADAAFCRKVCAALKIGFRGGKWPRRTRPKSEAEARTGRMAFFARHARVVWFGHQQDDIAESMLMRLARGSGTGGLAAPRPIQSFTDGRIHLRPLLGIKKGEIAQQLAAVGVAAREDSSNEQGLFFRNRIRRDVLPVWITAAQRDALAGAAHARRLLEEDDTALAAWLAEVPWRVPRGGLATGALAGKPRALARRALHCWLLEQAPAVDLSRPGFEALLGAVERRKFTRHSLGREGFAVIRGGVLRFERGGKKRSRFNRSAN